MDARRQSSEIPNSRRVRASSGSGVPTNPTARVIVGREANESARAIILAVSTRRARGRRERPRNAPSPFRARVGIRIHATARRLPRFSHRQTAPLRYERGPGYLDPMSPTPIPYPLSPTPLFPWIATARPRTKSRWLGGGTMSEVVAPNRSDIQPAIPRRAQGDPSRSSNRQGSRERLNVVTTTVRTIVASRVVSFDGVQLARTRPTSYRSQRQCDRAPPTTE